MDIPLIFKQFDGGWSTDKKVGIKNSHAYSQSIDFRKSPSQLTILPAPAREDASNVADLVQNEVMINNGTIYSIGNTGKIYKRTTAGVWSMVAEQNAGTYGIDYRNDTDSIYIPGNTTVSWFKNISSSPVLQPGYFGSSIATENTSTATSGGTNINPYQTGGAQGFNLPTSIVEAPSSVRYFQSDIEPLQKISVQILSKGTGNWTVTLHDGNNAALGSATVTNANLTSGVFNDFTFSSPVRIYVSPNARTYHIHVTSTVNDGYLYCETSGDMQTANLEVFANRLIQTTNGMHPMVRFQQYECIGNANYLSVWEPISDPPTNAEWQRHRLVFPSEYEVCGLAVQNEFIAIALEKVTSSNTSVPQEGLLAFWDGVSPTYNYFVKVPEGSPQAIHEYKNVIYYYAGGAWYAIASPTTQPVKIRTMPDSDTIYTSTNSYLKIYPYAATVRRGIHLMAYPSITTDTTIDYAVYSWGSVDKNFPESFGKNYVISTASQNYTAQNNLTIGMVKNFGDTLHISWRDDTNGGYGVDVVNNSSTPATTYEWQSLIFDNGSTTKLKKALYVEVGFEPLPDGVTITPEYNIDRSGWTSGSTFSNADLYRSYTNMCRIDIPEGDFHEIQIGFNGTATTTTPIITSVILYFNDKREEFRQ